LDQFGFEVAYACSPRDEEDVVKVKEAFESKEPRTHERLELNLQGDVKIPADIFGQHQTRELVLSGEGLKRPLSIDSNAFKASAQSLRGVEFQNLNLEKMDFSFLKHFPNLERVEFTSSKLGRQMSLPLLPNLKAVEMFDSEVGDVWPIPVSNTPNLKSIELYSLPGADDGKVARLLDSIPQQVTSFTCSECGLTQLPLQIQSVEGNEGRANPNALHGDLKMRELDLSDNKLTKMEESAFRSILESMARTNGFLEIGDNPLACDCHMSWVVRDQRQLLQHVRNGQCADGELLENLDPKKFAKCA